MRFRIVTTVVFVACSTVTSPGRTDVSAVVFGRITTTTGRPVPGATVIVETLADSTGNAPYTLQCIGSAVLQQQSTQLDTAGFYRIEVKGRAEARKRACVEITGDPHGIYSDVGIKRAYGGWIQLRAVDGVTVRDSLRVDVRYAEMP